MPPGFDNFDPSCIQKSYHILVPSLVSVPHKPLKTFGHFCLSFTALRNTQALVSVIFLPKFRHTYFTISAKKYKAIQKILAVRITTKLRSL